MIRSAGSRERVLVIRLSSLGDMVMSMPAFQTIRRHHAGARVTLLTTRPYAGFMAASPWFDAVQVDSRPKWSQPLEWLRLARRLRKGQFDCVYDLQNADRTGLYLRLLGRSEGRVVSSTSRAANRRWTHPDRFSLSIAARHNDQLAVAGVQTPPEAPLPDLSWVDDQLPADIASALASIPEFALLVPGASSHRSVKRWSATDFGQLAVALYQAGLVPVILGTALESGAAGCIRSVCPGAVDLTGKTDFFDLVRLGRRARVAVGGDTGPLHLVAASGAPSVALISGATNPSCMPRGPRVTLLKREDLQTLDVDAVRDAVFALLERTGA